MDKSDFSTKPSCKLNLGRRRILRPFLKEQPTFVGNSKALTLSEFAGWTYRRSSNVSLPFQDREALFDLACAQRDEAKLLPPSTHIVFEQQSLGILVNLVREQRLFGVGQNVQDAPIVGYWHVG